ncbi:MAG: serine/threonine protein kinase [Elusimicrobia bacterium]|nr:serine/threonine protein kinase [Elusimicrobiota bacterium]
MSRAPCAALTLLLAVPALGADAGPPALGQEMQAIQRRHQDVARALEQTLAEIVRERRTYEAAPDDAAFAAWRDAVGHAQPLSVSLKTLAGSYRAGLMRLEVSHLAGAIGSAAPGRPRARPPPAEMSGVFTAWGEIDAAGDRLIQRFRNEQAVYEKAQAAHPDAQRRRRRVAALRRLAPAGAAAAAAALLWVWRRKPMAVPVAVPLASQVIAGNIELKGLIGRGAMGEVYEGLDKTLNRRVALKRLRPELLANPEDLELLLTEARTVAALKHPNIVAIRSVERHGGQVYLAFEFVDGSSLARILEERRRLDWAEALRVFKACCAALLCAHEKRIVHRDLKPANVMIARDGTVKVMDFGIAYTAQKSISRLTRAAAWGTPPYMAPEQELGGVSAAVDLFALSVCLYEMLTGELPFKGPNFLAQKREAYYRPVGELVPGLAPGVDAFFRTALAPEPSRRYPSAAALAAAAEAAR